MILSPSSAAPARSLRALCLIALGSLLFAATAHAQWKTTTYTLKGGWNSIYLHGDASYATLETIFASQTAVEEVWRWNPNPTQVGFTASPLIPSAGTAEWSTWVRGGSANSLGELVGQTAYLVKCSGTTSNTYSVTIPQKVMPPSASWVRNGANLMGFPSKLNSSYPTLAAYFATFPAAIASNVKIYKYVGGDLGPGNPLQVYSTSSEKLDRNQAYWFDSEVVGNFYAPVEISTSSSQGLDFARGGSVITVRLRNRSSAVSTVTITPLNSADAPGDQETVAAGVPLIRRTLDATSGAWSETALSANASFPVVVGPQSTVELSFGINRGSAAMTSAPADALFASLLRFTDSAGLYDISLPVTARKASLAGLWIGEASVANVVSQAAASAGTTTAKPYPLRVLIHVDAAGQARLLSQVYLGELAAGSAAAGLCLQENQLKAGTKASALRFSVAHLPLDRVIAGTGAFALGSSLECTIQIPYNDPTNPFLHEYHPDHDNKDARFEDFALPVGVTATTAKLSDGVEAPAITRACKFQFASSGGVGFGSSLVSGSYSESFTGLHQKTLQVSGTFELQRVSEIATLTQ